MKTEKSPNGLNVSWEQLEERCKAGRGRQNGWHWACDFLASVEKHYKERHPLSFYVKELLTSESTLRDACLKVLGHSPHFCIECRVVHEAILMIGTGRQRFTDISSELGYHDHSHFVRVFKKHTGLTPRDFVKQW
jgi:AraC-like DNA-binding protein